MMLFSIAANPESVFALGKRVVPKIIPVIMLYYHDNNINNIITIITCYHVIFLLSCSKLK